ncbi:hypothetical protein [Alkaliphilus serpentinus]|uniref:Uncharacterized protein n=1 Tax=Alkaliphilus serpentinus TaxID=1482731 RepID=A0A833M6K3_9FIRM|nr:hypothetical protein [Alkaliphilus serpentinus]KAB3527623.1 hypothetical protein F8153_11610 [Alkaliphilus serpentinus]
MKVSKIAILILTMVLFTTCISYGNEVKENNKEKIIMVVINRVDFLDLYAMDQSRLLIDHGYIGLMNTKVSGGNSQYKAYATIGWGTRSEATRTSSIFSDVDDEVVKIFERRTGTTIDNKGVINLNINQLIQQNQKGDFNSLPGILGDYLLNEGLEVAVMGNSDTTENLHREVGLIAMNSKGYIPHGDIGRKNLLEDPTRPFGLKTDYNHLYSSFLGLYPHINLLVIETGDMNRLEAYRENLSQQQYNQHKEMILRDIDLFLEKLMAIVDFSNTSLMLVTPYPSDDAGEYGERLTPLVLYDGDKGGGFITSDTTRRKGIIGNIDVAPYILKEFGLEAENMTGKFIEKIPDEDNIEYILSLNNRVVNTSKMRYRVLYSFALYEMLASVIALLAIIFKGKIRDPFKELINLLLLATIIPPFVFLILPVFGYQTIINTYLLLIALSTIMVIIIYRLSRYKPLLSIAIATSITMIGLSIDIITGQNFIKQSIMGYDPIIGARYYGIGNEYAGILLGCSLIAISILMEINKKFKFIIPVIVFILILLMGVPTLGANVGATITAIFAYGFILIKLYGGTIQPKTWIYILLLAVGAITTLALIDLLIVEKSSHLAGAIKDIIEGGPSEIVRIITRKVSMNIRVMGVTIWSRVLLIAIGVLTVIFYKPVGLFRRIADAFPSMVVGWSGILVACVVGFLVNDSGVVTAAMAAIYLTTSILYLVLNASLFIGSTNNLFKEGCDLTGKE